MSKTYLDNSGLNYFWNKIKSVFVQKSTLATVATSGSYNDLSDKPAIDNGQITIKSDKYAGMQWRTPSKDEWLYLLGSRSGNRYAKCRLDGKYNCLIIFPDNYSTTLSDVNNTAAAFESNQLTIQDANNLTNDGCVILPFTGFRNGSGVGSTNTFGYYWSSAISGSDSAWIFYFNALGVNTYASMRHNGFSVRLVLDSPTGSITINQNGDKVSFAPGNLQYKASTNVWKFAEHQWDFVGDANYGNVYEGGVKCNNALISSTYDGWIDCFGYGCNGINNGQIAYQTHSTSTDDTEYYNQDLSGLSDYGYAYAQNQKERIFTANQSSDTTVNLHEVAFTGDYNDLSNKPVITTGTTNGTINVAGTDVAINFNLQERATVTTSENASSLSLTDNGTISTLNLTGSGAHTITITSISQGYAHYVLVHNDVASTKRVMVAKDSSLSQTLLFPSSISVNANGYVLLRIIATSSNILVTKVEDIGTTQL